MACKRRTRDTDQLCLALFRTKEAQILRVKYWEIIVDNLSKAGWSWGCVSAMNRDGRLEAKFGRHHAVDLPLGSRSGHIEFKKAIFLLA
jgi:hypothetical protein